MWKLSNSTNKEYLDKFYSEISLPLFDFIIKLKYDSFTINNFVDFEKAVTDILKPNFPLVIFKKKHDEIECYKLILELLKSSTLKELIIQKKQFKIQNGCINIGNYSIKPMPVPDELYKIFSKILYEKCFDNKDCWDYIQAGFKYNRVNFHDNFKTENDDRTICSLCDIDTIIIKSNSIIEHFLPRNLFPYLSLNANNLTSCCNACNLGEDGKGISAFSPMVAPFRRQIGESVKFDIHSNKIVVSSKEVNIGIDNYIKMMKLNKRFSSNSVFTTSMTRLNADVSMHNRMKKNIPDNEELLKFFKEELENRKYEGFHFLKKYYFNGNYKEYLDKIN